MAAFPFGPILGHFLPVSDFEASAGIKIEEDTEMVCPV